MRCGQASEWGREVNMILWVGPFGPIQYTIVAFAAGCIVDTDILHACILNVHKVQRRVF